MTGVVEDAEDIVQEVFLKWMAVPQAGSAKAYLARMVVNQSIRRLEEIKKQRELYTGTWLPEPYITLEKDPGPTLEYGLLFLLERLNPIERAVFILRESFSEEYKDIAEVTGLSEDNCRQLLHRSKEKLERGITKNIDRDKQLQLTHAFLNALHSQNLSTLQQLLKNDIELYSDGGGKRAVALKPLFGLNKVVKFLMGVAGLPESQEHAYELRSVFVNGYPAVLLYNHTLGHIDSVQYVEFDGPVITRLLFVRNPDKLKVRTAAN